MINRLSKLLLKTEYNELALKTELSLVSFLQYARRLYPNYEDQDFVNFYLKERALQLGKPISIQCELTPLCNLRCKMCYVQMDSSPSVESQILTTEVWIKILEEAIEAGIYEVTLTGGEAMMHKGFWEIYNFLYSKGIKITVFTNGLLLNDQAIRKFVNKPPEKIQLSLYGSNDDTYEDVTGKRVFGEVSIVLEKLKVSNIPFVVAITPSKYLLSNISSMFNFLLRNEYSFRVNRALMPPREETKRFLDDTSLSTDEYIEIWKMYESKTGEKAFNEDVTLGDNDRIYNQNNKLSCAAGRSTCHIDYKGRMNGCVLLSLSDKSVVDNSFIDTWEHIHEKYCDFLIPVECVDCELLPKCNYCIAEHKILKDRAVLNTKVCERTKKYISANYIKKTY